MAKPTSTMTKILLEDMLRISPDTLPYEKIELQNLLKSTQILKDLENPWQKLQMSSGNCSFMTVDAGHIPGSLMFVVSIDGKSILYTGDFNTRDTRLVWGARTGNIPPLDAVIIESTYATISHPLRLDVEKEFIDSIKRIIGKGGKVLIPAFGLARSQEIMCVLQTYGVSKKIVIDGMAREISQLLLRTPTFLRISYNLDKFQMIKRAKARSDRINALKQADIIIAPSGMMKGGTVRFYAEHMLPEAQNGVFLVSYQVEGTPGRVLLEKHEFTLDDDDVDDEDVVLGPSVDAEDHRVEVNADVAQFDFSSHCDGPALIQFLQALKFKDGVTPKIFCIHGDRSNCDALAAATMEQVPGSEAVAPRMNDDFEI
jgi:putative mRNA 3-end processing factor